MTLLNLLNSYLYLFILHLNKNGYYKETCLETYICWNSIWLDDQVWWKYFCLFPISAVSQRWPQYTSVNCRWHANLMNLLNKSDLQYTEDNDHHPRLSPVPGLSHLLSHWPNVAKLVNYWTWIQTQICLIPRTVLLASLLYPQRE